MLFTRDNSFILQLYTSQNLIQGKTKPHYKDIQCETFPAIIHRNTWRRLFNIISTTFYFQYGCHIPSSICFCCIIWENYAEGIFWTFESSRVRALDGTFMVCSNRNLFGLHSLQVSIKSNGFRYCKAIIYFKLDFFGGGFLNFDRYCAICHNFNIK